MRRMSVDSVTNIPCLHFPARRSSMALPDLAACEGKNRVEPVRLIRLLA